MSFTSVQVRTLKFNSSISAGEVKRWFEGVPDEATIRVNTTQGDRPFESGESYIRATWDEVDQADPMEMH